MDSIYMQMYDILISVFDGTAMGPMFVDLVCTILCLFVVLLPLLFVFAVLWRLLRR